LTFEEFKNLSSSIQSISIAIAVLVGGFWALYRFFSLKSIETASLELEKSKKELTSQAVLDVRMNAEAVPSMKGAAIINITIRNIGSKDETIDTVASTVYLAVVDNISDDVSSLRKKHEAKHLSIDTYNYFVIVSPGEVKTIPYLVTGLEDKVYLITSNLVASKELSDHHEAVALNSGLTAEYISFGGELFYDFHANKNLKRDC
jgi:hypothetical protein